MKAKYEQRPTFFVGGCEPPSFCAKWVSQPFHKLLFWLANRLAHVFNLILSAQIKLNKLFQNAT
jgi:hypothetical protein